MLSADKFGVLGAQTTEAQTNSVVRCLKTLNPVRVESSRAWQPNETTKHETPMWDTYRHDVGTDALRHVTRLRHLMFQDDKDEASATHRIVEAISGKTVGIMYRWQDGVSQPLWLDAKQSNVLLIALAREPQGTDDED